jgi:hypothetical protein
MLADRRMQFYCGSRFRGGRTRLSVPRVLALVIVRAPWPNFGEQAAALSGTRCQIAKPFTIAVAEFCDSRSAHAEAFPSTSDWHEICIGNPDVRIPSGWNSKIGGVRIVEVCFLCFLRFWETREVTKRQADKWSRRKSHGRKYRSDCEGDFRTPRCKDRPRRRTWNRFGDEYDDDGLRR